MSFPLNYNQAIRTFPCRNIGDEEIPPFGLVEIANFVKSNGEQDRFFSQEQTGHDIRWLVRRPTEETVAEGNPARFAFNMHIPIAKSRGSKERGIGVVTLDFPARVLHDGSTDGLPNGYDCGPRADSFSIWSDGSGFTCLSHDVSGAVSENATGIHTIFVARSSRQNGGHGRGTGRLVDGSPDSHVELALGSLDSGVYIDEATPHVIRVRTPGLYQFGWQCRLHSTNAPRGGLLQLTTMRIVRQQSQDLPGPTLYSGSRLQEYEQDGYGNDIARGQEHVAVTGWENLNADGGIAIKHTGSYKQTVASFSWWILKVPTPFLGQKPGGLVYP